MEELEVVKDIRKRVEENASRISPFLWVFMLPNAEGARGCPFLFVPFTSDD